VIENRVIDVYETKGTGESMKVFGFCRTHQETHSFHLHKILSAEKQFGKKRVGPYPYTGPKMNVTSPEDEAGIIGGSLSI